MPWHALRLPPRGHYRTTASRRMLRCNEPPKLRYPDMRHAVIGIVIGTSSDSFSVRRDITGQRLPTSHSLFCEQRALYIRGQASETREDAPNLSRLMSWVDKFNPATKRPSTLNATTPDSQASRPDARSRARSCSRSGSFRLAYAMSAWCVARSPVRGSNCRRCR